MTFYHSHKGKLGYIIHKKVVFLQKISERGIETTKKNYRFTKEKQ